MKWSEAIQRYRDSTGLTQDELASKIGVDTRVLRRWEVEGVVPSEAHQRTLRGLLLGVEAHNLETMVYMVEHSGPWTQLLRQDGKAMDVIACSRAAGCANPPEGTTERRTVFSGGMVTYVLVQWR